MRTSPTTRTDLGALRATLTDAFHRNRRLVTALLAAVAVILAISAVRGRGPDTTRVWVAARDLAGGQPLHRSDLAAEALPRSAVPAGALTARQPPVGVLLGAPVRRGEPLTDVRLLSPALLAAVASPHAVAVPVRVSDGPAALALVSAGQRVTVLAAADPGLGVRARVRTVVGSVRVLAVPAHTSDAGLGLIIVAASPTQAARLAAIPASDRVSVAVRR
ncbi:MAG TPA: SAF domain-containing protein [Mycobacteriales bacterium]|nr:SAF domain-containing protein [Mycobacteriales bacterium]